ncbi:MAG: type 1 glutamine amidotransferase domain-containing protein [Pseudomonadota bacterium]
MWRIAKYVLAGIVALVVLVRFGLPSLLSGMGLHPHYAVPDFSLDGRRALIISTSHGVLGDTGEPTGVFASEMTAPYYAFLDAGMTVDVASIQGGDIPIEPSSLEWPVVSAPDKRFLEDQMFLSKVARTYDIELVDMSDYDIVFLAGGWGAAYDFAQSEVLGAQMTAAYAGGAIIGGVCHGPLGLLQAQAADGAPLVAGRRLTAVTDKQISELRITHTPKHPERDLRAAGALFESDTAFRDFFANHVVIDGRIITGQNQNSGAETAAAMMQALINLSNGGNES